MDPMDPGVMEQAEQVVLAIEEGPVGLEQVEVTLLIEVEPEAEE